MHTVVSNLDQFNSYFNQPTTNPLVGVGDLSKASDSLFEPVDFGCYCVVLMESDFGELVKDDRCMRYDPNTMFTIKPGQVVATRLDRSVQPRGKILVFRPELMTNTGLGRDFYMFNFFDFDVDEALKLKDAECRIIHNCYANIDEELKAENDELTGHMLRLAISQLLSYCKRFYERQFDTVKLRSSDFIRRLDMLIEEYFAPGSDLPRQLGCPTVTWCSEQFHLAPNYFGNLVRRDLHISAQKYIHNKITERAKSLLSNPSNSIDNVSDILGFRYSNHFSRFFRKETGLTPTQFRNKAS